MKLKTFNAVYLTIVGLILSLSDAAPAQAGQGAKSIEPFLDDQVIAVVRVDTARIDPKALEQWIVETLQAGEQPKHPADAAHLKNAAAELRGGREQMQKVLGEFRAAGGRDIYMLLSTNLMEGPPILVSLAEEADEKKLAALVSGPGEPPQEAGRVGDFLVLGDAAMRQRLEDRRTAKDKRPAHADLMNALNAGGTANAAVHVAFAPSPDARRVFEELAPTLPPELGGGPTANVTGGVRWLTLSINLPPKPSVKLVIQAQDTAAAEAIQNLLQRASDAAEKAIDEYAATPRGKREAPMLDELTKRLPTLVPAREGDRLVLNLEEARLRELSSLMSVSLLRARISAMQVQSMSNIRQLLVACYTWAHEHNREFPDDLAAAMKAHDLPPQIAVNPRNPKTGYTYIKPPMKDVPSERIVIYEAEGSPDGRAVGYGDGHADWLPEEKFQADLEAQQEADKQQADNPKEKQKQ